MATTWLTVQEYRQRKQLKKKKKKKKKERRCRTSHGNNVGTQSITEQFFAVHLIISKYSIAVWLIFGRVNS